MELDLELLRSSTSAIIALVDDKNVQKDIVLRELIKLRNTIEMMNQPTQKRN